MPETPPNPYFQLLNEAGIITQIATTLLESRLPKGLLVSHFGVVNHLIRVEDGATPLKLARAFQVPKTTMTHTLAGLERAGLVEMRPNPDDKRSKMVWLTDKGRHFRETVLVDLTPAFAVMAERFEPDRVAAMLPDLAEFRAMIDKLRDELP